MYASNCWGFWREKDGRRARFFGYDLNLPPLATVMGICDDKFLDGYQHWCVCPAEEENSTLVVEIAREDGGGDGSNPAVIPEGGYIGKIP